ncbi:MAG: YegP family protein [Pseudomonadota bacterium]
MAHPSFILKKAKNDQFYFVLTAKNGQVIAQSEMYTTKSAAENGIDSVKENAPAADIDDQSEAA